MFANDDEVSSRFFRLFKDEGGLFSVAEGQEGLVVVVVLKIFVRGAARFVVIVLIGDVGAL